MAKSKDEAVEQEAVSDPRAEFLAKLRDIRTRVGHHAHRAADGEVRELGKAVCDLVDLMMAI